MPRGKSGPQQKAAATRRKNKVVVEKKNHLLDEYAPLPNEGFNITNLLPVGNLKSPEKPQHPQDFAAYIYDSMMSYTPEEQNEIFSSLSKKLSTSFYNQRVDAIEIADRRISNHNKFLNILQNTLNVKAKM